MSVTEGDPRGVWYDIESDEHVAANLTARSRILTAITERIRVEGWTQAEAAAVLQITQPSVSDLFNGKLSKFDLDALVNMLPALGLKLEVVPSPPVGHR
jgi:predicted XRE-type DNA-binding protein